MSRAGRSQRKAPCSPAWPGITLRILPERPDSDFFHTNLEQNGFVNQGTVYINLDAFWNNLNSFQLQSFVNHCHALGQKAGIYSTVRLVWLNQRRDQHLC